MEQQRYPARYSDGHSAANQAVEVILAPHGLAIQVTAGPHLWWPFDEVRASELPDAIRVQRGVATLVVEGPAFQSAWRQVRGRGKRELRIAIGLGALGIVAAVVLLSFLIYGFSWMTGAMASLLPLKTEETIGRAALENLAPKHKRCIDPVVERIVEALRATLRHSPYTFRVFIAEESTVNAFAAPGGYIVIYRGLLDKTRRPEEAAAVLAHEMQHVVHRHSVRGMMRGVSIWLALALLTGDPSATLASLAGALGALHYQRGDEEQADRDGLRMMEHARMDPKGMVTMLQLLDEVSGDMPRAARYLSSHPLTEDRIRDIRRRVDRSTAPVNPLLPGHRWPPDRQACLAAGTSP